MPAAPSGALRRVCPGARTSRPARTAVPAHESFPDPARRAGHKSVRPRRSIAARREAGALWPPAVSPSTTKPSTLPLDLRASVMASVADATMPRNSGRFKVGALPPQKAARVKVRKKFFAGQRAFDVNFQLHRLALGQPVEHAGNAARDARSHQHVIHARRASHQRSRAGWGIGFFPGS